MDINKEDLSKEELEKRVKWYGKKYGPYIDEKNRGLHNWKNLFRLPTMYEWIILLMLLMSIFMAWSYKIDVENSFYNGYNTCLYENQLSMPMQTQEWEDWHTITPEIIKTFSEKLLRATASISVVNITKRLAFSYQFQNLLGLGSKEENIMALYDCME